MNIYRETIPMKKHAALGLGAQSRYLQTSNYPSPLYKFEIVLSNYLRNRVSFAAIAVFYTRPRSVQLPHRGLFVLHSV